MSRRRVVVLVGGSFKLGRILERVLCSLRTESGYLPHVTVVAVILG
jgi:hypothetical protein